MGYDNAPSHISAFIKDAIAKFGALNWLNDRNIG